MEAFPRSILFFLEAGERKSSSVCVECVRMLGRSEGERWREGEGEGEREGEGEGDVGEE